ncbi:MAG: hypothetical protein AAFN11_07270, partial [Chloroflexota bacterium]
MATQEEVNGIFPAMLENFQTDKADGANATIQFNLTGDNGGMYWLKVEDGSATHGTGDVESDMTVEANADDFAHHKCLHRVRFARRNLIKIIRVSFYSHIRFHITCT